MGQEDVVAICRSFMSRAGWKGRQRKRLFFLPPTFLPSLSTIKHWDPSEDPPLLTPPTHPPLPRLLTRTSTSAPPQRKRESKREGGMKERMDKGFWEERENVWSAYAKDIWHGPASSEVSFIVFFEYLWSACGLSYLKKRKCTADCGHCPATENGRLLSFYRLEVSICKGSAKDILQKTCTLL